MPKPRILVTGAKGQLGITLNVMAQELPRFEWVFCDKKELDICNSERVAAIFKRYNPDYCINTAAFTNVALAEKQSQQAKAVNETAVKTLVEQCNLHHCCLLHLSTDYVFNGQQTVPYVESDQTAPLNVYGKTKARGEQWIVSHAKHFYIVRTSWLYAKTHGQNFYRSILDKAKAGEALTVVDDQVGTPTSTDQLATFLIRLIIQSPKQGLYHYAGSVICSWYAFAKKVLEENQLEVKLTATTSSTEKVLRPRFSALGTEKEF